MNVVVLSTAELEELLERVVDRALARRDAEAAKQIRDVVKIEVDVPRPLAEILGRSAEACRKFERRNPDLRAIAVSSDGPRRLYRRADVLRWLAEHKANRKRPGSPRLKVVGS